MSVMAEMFCIYILLLSMKWQNMTLGKTGKNGIESFPKKGATHSMVLAIGLVRLSSSD